jgi:bis(5'-nucleosidyl)-tetraphosphatase
MKKEESFGVVPLKNEGGSWYVFMIQLNHSRFWGFPKGHAEEGESALQSAKRELKEETNLEILRCLKEAPLKERYQFSFEGKKIDKQVHYFVAEVVGEIKLQQEEVKAGKWFLLDSKGEQPTHAEARTILREVEKIVLSL